MKRFILLVGLLTFLSGAALFSPGVKLSSKGIVNQNDDIVLSWTAAEEVDVVRYEVHRRSRMSNDTFVKIATLSPHGPNLPYEFRDSQVYKTSDNQVYYKVLAVYTETAGGPEIEYAITFDPVSYSATAVRRTWGSIKAMFQ